MSEAQLLPELNDLGWVGIDREAASIQSLKTHLEARSGLPDFEIFAPDDVEAIRQRFYRDGFVVVRDALTAEQLEFLRTGVEREVRAIIELDPERGGNRGSHRYSFGGANLSGHLMHREEWAMLLDLPTITPLVSAIFGSTDYHARGGGGDFCLPGAVEYQPLHSDMSDVREFRLKTGEVRRFGSFKDPRGLMSYRDLPPNNVVCNFMTVDSTPLNGPIRQIPGTQNSHDPIPSLEDEPGWMKLATLCPAPAGSVILRDMRTWHGGTPNVSDEVRAIPNVEFYAPWFIEPQPRSVPRDIYESLSDHARHLCRFISAEPGEDLVTGVRAHFGWSPFE